ncbi:hypothetical protein EVAR_28062_1 [Eumeta japonica]|uniref:Uncharacterized protein n=1 Tax=Eumeta variegata TaxID=151549 RepID=A0A4C1W640_EUMVA|nr:hypothetical protein EVAR_28062_1 [Eumeta japonica]
MSLFYLDASADGVEKRSLSLARSAQAERDNESCSFFDVSNKLISKVVTDGQSGYRGYHADAPQHAPVVDTFSRGCLPEQSLSGFAQRHTGTRTRSPRAAVCPSYYSFQEWQGFLHGLVLDSPIVFSGDKYPYQGIESSRLDCGDEIRHPSCLVPQRGRNEDWRSPLL